MPFLLLKRLHQDDGSNRRMGGAKRYPSACPRIDGYRCAPPILRIFFDHLSAISPLLILEFSIGTPATTTVWRSSTRNPCLAKKPSAERLTWADSFRSPRSSATPWTCCISALPTPRAGKSPDTKK